MKPNLNTAGSRRQSAAGGRTRDAVTFCTVLGVLLAPAFLRAQSRIEGQVINGTTGQPAAKQELRLLQPRGGMQQVASATTDAQGRFVFPNIANEAGAFYLISIKYQGVDYNEPGQFDSPMKLTVYEATRSDPGLRVELLRLAAQPAGSKVRVQEQFTIQNSSRPPRAFAATDGTFRFRLPPQVTEPSVGVTGLMNMQLPQTPEKGKSPGEFFLLYPMKPGATVVTLQYETDYDPAGFELTSQIPYPIDRSELYVAPASLSVESKVFEAAGVDTKNGIATFQGSNVPRGATLEVHLSGAGAPVTGPAEAGRPEGQVSTIPNAITRLGWPLWACFLLLLLWALGVRAAKDWPSLAEQNSTQPARKQFESKVEGLLNSLADLDELFAAGKIAERKYWKERLELKAKLVAILKKSPPAFFESYATRNIPR
jgi:5-hydroxyisourate hydrolase-like protein (transthyretin family)